MLKRRTTLIRILLKGLRVIAMPSAPHSKMYRNTAQGPKQSWWMRLRPEACGLKHYQQSRDLRWCLYEENMQRMWIKTKWWANSEKPYASRLRPQSLVISPPSQSTKTTRQNAFRKFLDLTSLLGRIELGVSGRSGEGEVDCFFLETRSEFWPFVETPVLSPFVGVSVLSAPEVHTLDRGVACWRIITGPCIGGDAWLSLP